MCPTTCDSNHCHARHRLALAGSAQGAQAVLFRGGYAGQGWHDLAPCRAAGAAGRVLLRRMLRECRAGCKAGRMLLGWNAG